MMRTRLIGSIAVIALLGVSATKAPAPTVREILDPFTGHWKGTFTTYSLDGSVSSALPAEQRFWWDGDTQRGRYFALSPNGGITTAESQHFTDSGLLVRDVQKSTGQNTRHYGHFENGTLTWSRKQEADEPGGYVRESFRERVIPTASGQIYEVTGTGVYGVPPEQNVFVFEGRYKKIDTP
jgi:hypothetical protein